MGFSLTIIAFDRKDAPRVLARMGWTVTDHQVGIPVDVSTTSLEDLLSPDRQADNDPHFSAAMTADHFFVYVSLKVLRPFESPDLAQLSAIAPLTLHTVVETSSAATVEHWSNGQLVWSVGGGSGVGYEVTGPSPIDLDAEADAYRIWWNSLPHDLEFVEPGELDLPESNADLIVAEFSSLVGNYFARTTGFRYAGDHPDLFRLTGELPIVDSRNRR